MIRRATLLVLLLVPALLGAGLWFGPRLLDWEKHRGRLADLASFQLGRDVSFDGPITLTLLPQPVLQARSVSIGPAQDGLTATARALRLRLDLPALLTGRLEPREIALLGADIRMPWPPDVAAGPRTPSWLTALDARIEQSRLHIGELQLDGVQGRLTTGSISDMLQAEGSFAWHGFAVRFRAQLGRAGLDGVAPLEIGLASGGTVATARGALLPDGHFEGVLDAGGSDLSLLLPAPAGPFRAEGPIIVTAEALSSRQMRFEHAGQSMTGALELRVLPQPRLDIAVTGARFDADPWLGSLRAARGGLLPFGITVAAEAGSLGGLPLRRLRGGVFLEGDRLALSDIAAILPGETQVDMAGATAQGRLELAVHFRGPALRDTLAALGLPVASLDPSRLRLAEGRFRLAVQDQQVALSDIAALVDGARISGDAVWRPGVRRSLGIGLSFDRLDLNGLLPDSADWPALAAGLPGLDLNLRLAADQLRWQGHQAERAVLDATIEGGRAVLRRLALRALQLDASLTGAVALGEVPRFSDVMLELSGSNGAGLLPLLPERWALPGLREQPVLLRLHANGPADAVAIRTEGDAGEMRLEAQGTLDATRRRATGMLTLRHPGAPRLLAPLLGSTARDWLGQGSFALIANASLQAQGLGLDSFDLVAGGLRSRGQLALAWDGPRPRLTGRVAAERLPLPGIDPRDRDPWPLSALRQIDAELALSATRIELLDLPPVDAAEATLQLEDGQLRIDNLRGQLAEGRLQAALALDSGASPPQWNLEASLAAAQIAGPVLGLPLDIGVGQVNGAVHLQAAGHSPAGLVATLQGTAQAEVRNGMLLGADLAALAQAAAKPALPEAETALRVALSGGTTAFTRLSLDLRLDEGRAQLGQGQIQLDTALPVLLEGATDLNRDALDLRLKARPMAAGPDVSLRLTGPAASPQRLPELAPFLRWRAERG